MKNRDYWRRRFEILEASAVNKGQDYLLTLDREYKTAMKNVEAELSKWYQRFAGNNGITLAEAKQWLTKGELAEFKWSVEEYIKYGQENALNRQWMKQLENASAKVHVSRLQALQVEMQQKIEALYGNQLDGIDALARKIYTEGYYHTAFEVQKGFNIGWDLTPLNQKQLDLVVTKPWTLDKETFSYRIWKQKNALVNRVQTEMTQSLLRGDSPDKAIKGIAKQFDVSRKQAGRLVMTESAYFASEAQKDCFKALDVERFEIVATLDSHTSELCQSLDGHIEEMKNYEAGVTAPPFHPWCRTTTVPYFEDNFGERAARGADGKTYYVPSNMKYADWKKTFVDDGSKSGLKEVSGNDILDITKFVPAKTLAEAEEFALNELNIAANYQKYNLDVANAVNETVVQMRDTFGSDCFKDGLHGIGTFPKGHSTRNAGAFVWHKSTEIGDLWLRNVSPKNALEKLKSVAEGQFQMGFWSTGEAMHTIRHELGHALARSAIQRNVQGTMFDEVTALKDAIQAEVFKAKGGTAMYPQYLSKYAFTNTAEFIAESVAEYFSESPRETSTKVVEIMIKHLKGGS